MKLTIAWVLAAILCVGLLVGCDKPKDEGMTTTPEQAEPPMFPESTVPPAEQPKPEAVPVVDTTPKEAPAPKESYAAPKAPKTHVIQKGETLQSISNKYYGTTKNFKKIFNANKNVLKDMNTLKPGTKIVIP